MLAGYCQGSTWAGRVLEGRFGFLALPIPHPFPCKFSASYNPSVPSERRSQSVLRLGLIFLAIAQFVLWILRSHLNDITPLPPINPFDIVTALVLALPYLFVLRRSYGPQPGAFEAAVGCAIGLAAANLMITVFAESGGEIKRRLILGTFEAGLLLLGLSIKRQIENGRKIWFWAALSPVLLLLWYAAFAGAVYAYMVKTSKPGWH
jgi:hypothetical protein